MNYESLLNDAIKTREAKREKLQEDIAVLKMHAKQVIKNEEKLREIGYSYTEDFKNTLVKIENVSLNTMDSITEEDLAALDIEYNTTQDLIKSVEASIRELIGLENNIASNDISVVETDIFGQVNINQAQNSGSICDELKNLLG